MDPWETANGAQSTRVLRGELRRGEGYASTHVHAGRGEGGKGKAWRRFVPSQSARPLGCRLFAGRRGYFLLLKTAVRCEARPKPPSPFGPIKATGVLGQDRRGSVPVPHGGSDSLDLESCSKT